jgi:hypothetical protein
MPADRKTIIALVTLVIIAAFSTASISTVYYKDKPAPASTSKYVGTYYTANGGAITLHSDGTASSVLAEMFGFTEQKDFRRATPSRGIWRQVGKNKIQVILLFFFTQQYGDNYYPDGYVAKIKYYAEFNNKNNKKKKLGPTYISSEVLAEIFTAGQNPITDEPLTEITLDKVDGYRLTAD